MKVKVLHVNVNGQIFKHLTLRWGIHIKIRGLLKNKVPFTMKLISCIKNLEYDTGK